ncbi:MAG: hypothetical protein PHD58_04675, partial [Anaerolineales bacterium]|nr:hypothetical protein [Anaerolineales bacterium]
DVEKRIASLEEQIGHIATLLEKPPPESETVQRLGEDYVELQNKIEVLLGEWESLQPEERPKLHLGAGDRNHQP